MVAPVPDFDAARFMRALTGALGLAEAIPAMISDQSLLRLNRVYFMGAGGAQMLSQPAVDLLRANGTLPAFACHPAQVVLALPSDLDASTLVVIPSLSGTTRECVELLGMLNRRGIPTLALTGHPETPLAREARYSFTNPAEGEGAAESFALQALILALALLAVRGEFADFDAVLAELSLLPALLVAARANFEPNAAEVASAIRDEPWHIVTGAGAGWHAGRHFALATLEQRQWLRARPVHAADFFHGTLELIEPGVSQFVLKGEDAFRPLCDRVERFARRYTDKIWVIDAALVSLPGIGARTRALISPVILITLLECLGAHLAARRDHPLTTRRYYKRVEY